MFKFSQAFFLLEMLVATAQGIDLSIAGIQPSQADLKSDVKALQDLVQDLRTRLEEQIEKSPPPSPKALDSDLSSTGIQKSQADLKSDVKALQDLVQDLRTRLEEQIEKSSPSQNVQSIRSPTCEQAKVAFFAGLSKSIGPFTKDVDIAFDTVVANYASAYTFWSGRFTAPFNATYQFSVTLSAQHTKAAAVRLLKNGVGILDIWSVATPWWAPSSNVAILSLKTGDQIWVRLLHGASYCYGFMYTTFSGFLIFENED